MIDIFNRVGSATTPGRLRTTLARSGVLLLVLICGYGPVSIAGELVDVLYARSLVNLMERGVGPAFDKASGNHFQGYASGSNALASQILGRLRRGDLFISANPKVNERLMGPANSSWVSWYISFAESPVAARLAACIRRVWRDGDGRLSPFFSARLQFVAFGGQGLQAMLPVLLPTILPALAIMALGGFAVRSPVMRRVPSRASTFSVTSNHKAVERRPQASAPKLSLRLEKRLGSFHLNVEWAPETGRLAILGPSGSGKSLTLKLIAGIEESDRGSIVLDGRDISRSDPAERLIAYVPQNYALFPRLTVIEHLVFPFGSELEQARHWIERLGLKGLEQRHPAELSLGQQQRVALARALVRPAKLLLLDEPFSALDAPLRSNLREELAGLQSELTATTVLVTHDPAEAARVADEVLLLEAGAMLQSGPTRDVFRRPVDQAAARLLGAENVAAGFVARDSRLEVGAGLAIAVAAPLRPRPVPSSGGAFLRRMHGLLRRAPIQL
jgi:ABC-type sulfate/molybdate transport systems ATPase subunit